MTFEGREAYIARQEYLWPNHYPPKPPREMHMMSNVIIERETDEEADVIVYQLLIRRVGDGSPEQRGLPAIHNCSRSRDHLVKESGQWRIKERRLQVEY